MIVAFEPRVQDSRWRWMLTPVLALVAALVVMALIFLFIGVNPAAVYSQIIETSLTADYALGDTLAKATPLILTSLAVAFAFKMKVLSIGAEGQLLFGAIFATSAAIFLDGQPMVVVLPGTLAAGALGGIVWALIPGFLAAYAGVSIVITTLLLNFVATLFATYLIFGSASFLTENLFNFPQGREITREAWLSNIGSQSVTWGLAIALAAAVVVWCVFSLTRFGYNMKVTGDSQKAARYSGVNVKMMIILVMVGSGTLAGLAGAVEVAGRTHALDPHGLALGLGYTGIAVAVLARFRPLGIVIVSVLIAALINSGSALQSLSDNKVPAEIVDVMVGVTLIFALMGEVFVRNRLRFRFGHGRPMTGLAQVSDV